MEEGAGETLTTSKRQAPKWKIFIINCFHLRYV